MKKVIRLTEADLHRMIKESVNQILKENNNKVFCTVNVECYDNNDDIVFVCVPTENEGKAMSMCRKIGYEPIDVTNGWCNSTGNLTHNEHILLQRRFVISDEPITSEYELEGIL